MKVKEQVKEQLAKNLGRFLIGLCGVAWFVPGTLNTPWFPAAIANVGHV